MSRETSGTRRLDGRRPSRRAIEEAFLRTQTQTPRLVGDGPAHFTAHLAVERQPFKWDTNSFYRRLGLTPDCTRLDLVAAYHASDPALPDFDRRMIALRVLLKKSERTRYDSVPLGAMWMDDPDLFQSMIEHVTSGEEYISGREEWGVYADIGVSEKDALRLRSEWRPMLARALDLIIRRRSIPYPVVVALGVTDRPSRSRWEQVGYIPVLFVTLDEEPSLEYVSAAAEHLMRVARFERLEDDSVQPDQS